jgi:hypothetical protein
VQVGWMMMRVGTILYFSCPHDGDMILIEMEMEAAAEAA